MKLRIIIGEANKLVSAFAIISVISAGASCSRREPKIDTSAPTSGTKPAPTSPGGDLGRFSTGGGNNTTSSRPTSGGGSTSTTSVAPRNNTTGVNPGPGSTSGVTPPPPPRSTTGVNPGPGSTSGVNPGPGPGPGPNPNITPRNDSQVSFNAKVELAADGPRVKADLPSGSSNVAISYQKVDGTANSTSAVVDISFKMGTKTCSAIAQAVSMAGTQVTASCK
ncbi:MAG: hypothetical protein RIQ81_717 [Pseudomonadota bacterium]